MLDRMKMSAEGALQSDDSNPSVRLGMESRSILKSIQTEESKLHSNGSVTRSDLHYFRARFNYYRLSLLRLPVEEREVLEPYLNNFHHRITELEQGEESGREISPPPFLSPVEKTTSSSRSSYETTTSQNYSQTLAASPRQPGAPTVATYSAALGNSHSHAAPSSTSSTSSFGTQTEFSTGVDPVQEAIGQLALLKMALASPITPENRQVLSDSVERVIRQLQKTASYRRI